MSCLEVGGVGAWRCHQFLKLAISLEFGQIALQIYPGDNQVCMPGQA